MYRVGYLISRVNSKTSLFSSSRFSYQSRHFITTFRPPAVFVDDYDTKKVFHTTAVGLRQSTCVGKGEDPFDGKFLSDPQREGLNQFKAIFLGTGILDNTFSTPKRIHAGRKHNDLDDVGKDTHHRTFFEVLGNWSFGDCFKSQAISWALELLTQVCKLPADRICAMYFGCDEKLSLEGNDEARDIGLEFSPGLPFGRKNHLLH
ncbi:alanine--tRNA ligase-like [Papaver somniferum]|uniref:alanine--tRNA ligase-like n=1 Tax=Papaver somniferum TaxID=3469 RepID=UPI000E702785|nr:alanine--tRNA ligase-like [Papaver somniferum]